MRRPDWRREGRNLLSKCVVTHTGAEREARASDLRNPPEFAKRGVAAGHHAATDVIHHCGAYLRSGVNGVGVSEGTKHGVAFRAVISREGTTRGVGVKGGGAVADGHEGVPEFLLARRGKRAFHGRLDRGIREWLDSDGAGFGGGFGFGDRGVRKRGRDFGGF